MDKIIPTEYVGNPITYHIAYPDILRICTVNVEIFAQYLFSHISRMVSDARKYDVSENLNHYRLNGIRCKMRENMSTQKMSHRA